MAQIGELLRHVHDESFPDPLSLVSPEGVRHNPTKAFEAQAPGSRSPKKPLGMATLEGPQPLTLLVGRLLSPSARTIRPEVTTMTLPDTFPEGTVFLDMKGTPVTVYLGENRCFNWEDRDAATPRPVTLEAIAGMGKAINEAQFRALVHRAHTCALPALLVKAAKDLEHRRRDYAELWAQGLSEEEIRARMAARREKRYGEDPETLTLRTIAAAQRSARDSE